MCVSVFVCVSEFVCECVLSWGQADWYKKHLVNKQMARENVAWLDCGVGENLKGETDETKGNETKR